MSMKTDSDKVSVRHTDGPWRIGKDGRVAPDTLCVFGSKTQSGFKGACICRVAPPDAITPEDEANARLIAAAPDLLAACEVALRLLEMPDWKRKPEDYDLAEKSVRAAILKATKPTQ